MELVQTDAEVKLTAARKNLKNVSDSLTVLT